MFLPFVSKPSRVEAVYWDGSDLVLDAIKSKGCTVDFALSELTILAGVHGAQGYVDVPVGHYVLYSNEPEPHFWPCDQKMFEQKYEPEGAVDA